MPQTPSKSSLAKGAPQRLKMADVAKLCGVSISTVSRALADSPLIPQELTQKIKQIARDHGYVVNHAARNLRLRTTRTIGLVLPMGHETGQRLTDPFLLEFIGCLAEAVISRGYDLLLSKVPAPQEGWLSDLIQSQRFDGMLVLGQSDQHAAINEIAAHYAPMVVWGEKLKNQAYVSVGVDNIFAGRLATEHLLATGCRDILFLGPPSVPEVDSRFQGYRQALSEYPSLNPKASPCAPAQLVETHFTFESAYEVVKGLIKNRTKFDALFAASDVIAQGALTALAEAKISVPERVSVCGFDDVALAKSLSPPLTTISQDLVMGARFMVDLLFKRMAGDMTSSAVIPASLIVRGTTRAL